MTYYIRGALGGVFGVEPDEPLRAGERPVVVIDRDEWQRMVALWDSSWNDDNGADKAMEIDAIIAKVEENNK